MRRTTPLRVRKMAAARGLAKTTRRECSKSRPVIRTGMVGHHQQPPQPGFGGVDAPGLERAQHSPDDPHSVLTEIDQQGERGGDVQGDQEGQVERLVGRLRPDQVVPAEEGGKAWNSSSASGGILSGSRRG
jgi:hypothetical protein